MIAPVTLLSWSVATSVSASTVLLRESAMYSTVPLPAFSIFYDGASKILIGHNKRGVWVASGPGVVVLSVEKAVSGKDDAIIGTFT
jgi:hypothetical protein